jgi:pre-mRNA branch site protein p14
MYDIFGKYGALRQVRLGTTGQTRGTAYVVYEDIYDAKNACEHLNGFQVAGRYIVVRFEPAHESISQPAVHIVLFV